MPRRLLPALSMCLALIAGIGPVRSQVPTTTTSAPADEFKDLIAQGRERLESMDYSVAIERFDKAIALKASSANLFAWRGTAVFCLDRFDEARSDLKKAKAIDDQGLYVRYLNILMTSVEIRDRNKTFAAHWKLLDSFPASYEANIGLGEFYVESAQYDKALPYIETAMRTDPKRPLARCTHAKIMFFQGKRDEGIKEYRDVIRDHPRCAMAYNNLAGCYLISGDHEAAEPLLRRAIEIHTGYAEAFSNLGVVLGRKGNREEAAKLYLKAVTLRPEFTAAWANLGEAQALLGKKQDAIESYKRALKLAPNVPQIRDPLNKLLREVGEEPLPTTAPASQPAKG